MLYIDNSIVHVQNGSLKHARLSFSETCHKLQADGDELERIRETFVGIPMPLRRVVQWEGEMATFIARHLS